MNLFFVFKDDLKFPISFLSFEEKDDFLKECFFKNSSIYFSFWEFPKANPNEIIEGHIWN